MVKLEWGTKRLCISCGARFYDLQKSPATCPKCGTVVEQVAANRRSRGRSAIVEKSVELVDDAINVDDLNLDVEIDEESDEDDAGLIEDTSDLGEDLDDLDDMIESGDGESEER